MDNILKRAFINSIGTVAYVILIALLLSFLENTFSNQKETVMTSVSALLLFVCSAAITGYLVFGKPVMLYIDGKKKEALSLLTHTLGMLTLMTALFFIALFFYYRVS